MAIAPATDFVAELQHTIESSGYYMANHPFVEGIYNGTLSVDQIRGWALQDSQYRRAVPRLSTIRYLRCTDPEIQRQLAGVVAEESEGGQFGQFGHYELFLRLAEAIGLTREQVANAKPAPGAAAHVYWAELILWNLPWFVAMSAQLAGEGQYPPAAEKLSEGFQKHYGLSAEHAAFFDVHGEADEEHGDLAANIVRRYLVTPELQEQARAVIQRKLELQWDMWLSYQAY
jgi:pyrroloquinoline-quinone synthase